VTEVNDCGLQLIRRRRVCRSFTPEPVSTEQLWTILDAARWALNGGNRHINKFLVVQDPRHIGLVRSVAPGMLGHPTALIVVLTDLQKAAEEQVQVDRHVTRWIDVGTAAMNMSLAAEALGLGSCPTTSFSRSGLAVMLELPPSMVPEFILQLGYPVGQPQTTPDRGFISPMTQALSYWERAGQSRPVPVV
jgi:albonoursin synthase